MAKRPRRKPNKPCPSFPLTAHPNGQWCKKILGKLHFFGVWSDPGAAHQNYLRIAEDLHAGREPSPAEEGEFTVKELGNQFLAYQMPRVETGGRAVTTPPVAPASPPSGIDIKAMNPRGEAASRRGITGGQVGRNYRKTVAILSGTRTRIAAV